MELNLVVVNAPPSIVTPAHLPHFPSVEHALAAGRTHLAALRH